MKPTGQSLFLRWPTCWAMILLLGGSVTAEPPRTDRLGDPLPEGAIARLGTMRLRHDAAVTAIAFAPDGKTLASVDVDGAIRIWETATGRQLRCLHSPLKMDRGFFSGSLRLAYSPDGKLLASAGTTEGVFLWDPATGDKRAWLGENSMDAYGITCLAFAPDGKTLALGMFGTVAWWDVAARTRLRSLDGEHELVMSLAYSPDGKTLIYAGGNEEIALCNPATGKVIRTLRKPQEQRSNYFRAVAYSPDGKQLLIGEDGSCHLLDAVSGKELRRIETPPIKSPPRFAPNGEFVAAISLFGCHPWLWDLKRNKAWEFNDEVGRDQLMTITVSPDSKLLASAGADGRVHLWNIAARKEVELPAGDVLDAGTFALSRDGKTLAALDGIHQLRLWSVSDAKLHRRIRLVNDLVRGNFYPVYLALSPDASQLAVPDGDQPRERTMQVLDANTGKRRWIAKIAGLTRFAAYSPDGKLLAAAVVGSSPKNSDLCLWEAASGRMVGRLSGHTYTIVTGVFSPNGKLLVSSGEDHTLRVWDVGQRRERYRLKGHGGGATVSCLAFSADGSRLASGGDDSRICVWDAASGRRLYRGAIEVEQNVTCLALSADGKMLVANAGEGSFRLWEIASATASPPIEGHRAAITFAAFLPDGRSLLTASRDGTALVWDVAALRRRKPPQVAPVHVDRYGDPLPPGTLARLGSIRLQHKDGVDLVAFSPDGKILAAATANGERSLRLWDVGTGKALHRLSEGSMPWLGIAFSPDGKILAALCGEEIRLWDVASGAYLGVAARHKNSLSTFAFSPDGNKIAAADAGMAGGKDFKIYLWNLDSGELLRVFDGHRFSVQQIAFTADGKTLLSSDSSEVRVWDIASGKQRHRHDHGGRLAPNGQTTAFGDKEKLHVVDAASGRELWSTDLGKGDYTYSPDGKRLLGKGDYYYSLDGKRLLICSSNQPFRLYDSATGKDLHRSDRVPEQLDPFMRLCLSADGATFATADFNSILLWDTKTGRERRRPFAGHRSPITCLSFSPDGRTLVSASARGSVRLWDVATAKELRVFREPAAMVSAVVFSPDGRRIACGDRRNVVQIWDAATGAEVGRFSLPAPKKKPFFENIERLIFSPDGKSLAIGGKAGLFLWESATKKPPRLLSTRADVALPLTFSSDGRLTAWLATKEPIGERLSARHEIVVWDTATGRGPRRLSSWSDNIPWSIAVSPDGKCLALNPGIENGIIALFASERVVLYEMATGKEIRRFSAGWGEGRLTFSPDGRTLVAGGGIWDVASGKHVGEIAGPVAIFSHLACSPNGRLVASDEDSTILLHSLVQNRRQAPARTRQLSEGEFRAFWKDLSSTDVSVAWRAVHALVVAPRQSVPFLQTMLRPYPPVDQRQLKRWLTDLDSDVFLEREQARRALSKLGELAEPALRRTLKANPSLEVRRQLLLLLEQIDDQARWPDSLRILRGTAVLERIGTAESMALLRRLAGGAPEARLTREAADAVRRLTARTGKP
ncbi:MAG TPA: WD40 repeat domain-containing protein [Gemmataceae bacterium]|nr:WD40 repeat domain-containing protein [Gemmataceae bacterium]